MCNLALQAGFAPGVLRVDRGVGPVVGAVTIRHPVINKFCITGTSPVGYTIVKNAGLTNL